MDGRVGGWDCEGMMYGVVAFLLACSIASVCQLLSLLDCSGPTDDATVEKIIGT